MKFKGYDGLDYIRDQNWIPMEKTRKGWQKYADKIAANRPVKGFWRGVVTEMESRPGTLMISIGGQTK